MSSNVNYTIKPSFCLLLPHCTVKGSKLFPDDPRHIRSLRTFTQDIMLVVDVLVENNILMGTWCHACWFFERQYAKFKYWSFEQYIDNIVPW